jgi:glycosyltransferase involved in cell wall biosynthesis
VKSSSAPAGIDEIVVVDDNSADRTAEVARSPSARWS